MAKGIDYEKNDDIQIRTSFFSQLC